MFFLNYYYLSIFVKAAAIPQAIALKEFLDSLALWD